MINIDQLLLDEEKTILESIEVINNGGCQIALIINKDKKLIGTITDGDIRRSILKNINLKSNVKEIMNKNFKSCPRDAKYNLILQKMKKYSIQQIPLLNNNGIVVDVILNNDISQKNDLDNPVVIMAGGKGKRLRPYTENCPKPMIEINNKPILEILLEQYSNNGFKKFYFSVNYLKEQVINYFGNGEKWNVSIEYLEESSELGTAGSLTLLPKNISKPIIVTNGDVLTKIDIRKLIKYHEKLSSKATICVRDYEVNIPFGVITSNNHKLKDIVEKPSLNFKLNAGIYVINKVLINLIEEEGYIDMPDLLLKAKQNDIEINLYPIHEYWLDIGREETLKQAWEDWIT